MAPRRIDVKTVPKDDYRARWRKALDRRAAMERELAAGAADPALLLAVQGAIAACDALTIFHRGERATSDRHLDALEVIGRLTHLPDLSAAAAHLARLLRVKGEVEYTGRAPSPREAASLVEHARRFYEFVERHLPPDGR
jgi:HEPN domain-containing protein